MKKNRRKKKFTANSFVTNSRKAFSDLGNTLSIGKAVSGELPGLKKSVKKIVDKTGVGGKVFGNLVADMFIGVIARAVGIDNLPKKKLPNKK